MQLMTDKRIGALVVTEGERSSYRDRARLRAEDRADAAGIAGDAVRDIMTSPVIHVRPDQTTQDCMVLMGSHHMRHLPVMDGGKLVGMVSIPRPRQRHHRQL